jgi:hypothetical protein
VEVDFDNAKKQIQRALCKCNEWTSAVLPFGLKESSNTSKTELSKYSYLKVNDSK